MYSVPLTNVQVSTIATKCYTFARYLQLTQPQQICLNIAEIQVYSVVGGTNIALTSTATSSTVLSPYAPANIKDNNLTTFFHSSCGSNDWVQLDFGSSVHIAQIVVKNR